MHKNVRSPPEHFAIGYVHDDNYAIRHYCITICHSKAIAGRLDDTCLHNHDDFLALSPKIKIFEKNLRFTKTIFVALIL